jgi:hypothetical protein
MLRLPVSLDVRGALPEVLAAFSKVSGVRVTVRHRGTEPFVAVRVRDVPGMTVLRAFCAATGEPPPPECEAEEVELGGGLAVSAFFARLAVQTRLAILSADPLAGEEFHLWSPPDSLPVADLWVLHPGAPIQAGFCYAYDGDIMGFLYADSSRHIEVGVAVAGDPAGGVTPQEGESGARRMAESRVTSRFPVSGGPLWPCRVTSARGTSWAQPFGVAGRGASGSDAERTGGGDAQAAPSSRR